MADPAANGTSGKVVIRNVGLMLSGDIDRPILDADTVVVREGRIAAVGREADCDTSLPDVLVDARGTTLSPGLIDSHVHPVFGDWTPRQGQLGWIDSTMHGGVTTMISAGEVHLPGRPKDIVGLKALAITAQRAFDNFRPGGVKVLAGAPVIEKGMTEQDFADLAKAGVRLLGEVGLGSVKAGAEAKTMVAWARKHGIQSTIHTGGPSIPGSGLIDKDVVLEADAADRGSRHWINLQRLVQRTLPALRSALLNSPAPVLLVSAGLLARYDLMGLITELEESAGRPAHTHSVWLLLPTSHQGLPVIDGVAVPMVNNIHNTRALALPQAWIENKHRAKTATPGRATT